MPASTNKPLMVVAWLIGIVAALGKPLVPSTGSPTAWLQVRERTSCEAMPDERHDLLWQTATDRTEELGSCSTLCRLENRALAKGSVVNPSSVIRTVRGEFFCTTKRTNPGF